MDNRILTSPFLVVKNSETGQYSLVFSLEGESHELLVRNSKLEFEAAVIEVFGDMRKHPRDKDTRDAIEFANKLFRPPV